MAKLIPSFQIDHEALVPGIYESRVDVVGEEYVTTFDIRMTSPNREPAVGVAAMHTAEHIVATYLRNDEKWKDRIVYWGPMGCMTGCYLIVKGRPAPEELYPLILAAFEHLRDYAGEVPGTTPKTCGNYLMHDLPMAKWEAARFVERLKKSPCFSYPKEERSKTDTGRVFFDS